MQLDEAKEEFLIDGTSKKVVFDGNSIGVVGYSSLTKDSYVAEKIFLWVQSPLQMESGKLHSAYSMSEPAILLLENMGVDKIFICDAEEFIDFERLGNGEIISPIDDRFNEPREYLQRIVRVSHE